MQSLLYRGVTAGVAAPGFRCIETGDNGAYQACAGWSACTGLGVPDGAALAARLGSRPAAASAEMAASG
jgi:kumamolisin